MNAEAKPLKCGLIMPISAIDGCSEAHWDEVRIIIKEALAETPFVVELVSDSNEIGIIQKRIVENIYYNDIVVVDVSAKNPNVMFELGMRLAFDRPAIIIKDDKTNYSFDTSPIEHIQYPRDLHYHAIQAFKTKLREKVVATYEASRAEGYTTFLKHFGHFVVAAIEEKPVSKEDFILEAIADIRSEISSISKISAQKYWTSGSGSKNNRFPDLRDAVDSSKISLLIIKHIVSSGSPGFKEAGEVRQEVLENLVDSYMGDYSGPASSYDAFRFVVSDAIRKKIEEMPD